MWKMTARTTQKRKPKSDVVDKIYFYRYIVDVIRKERQAVVEAEKPADAEAVADKPVSEAISLIPKRWKKTRNSWSLS